MDVKIKIIIASLLKPVNDTRAYEKIGRSLAQTNKYEVNIIGFETKKTPVEENIFFWPLFNKNRKHFSRLIVPLKYFKILIKVRPQVLIVNSPELLHFSYLYKIIFGTQIIYDVRENYQMNLTYSSVYPKWQKPLLSLYLNLSEGVSRYFVSYYFLAERIYAKQLNFIDKSKFSFIENKAIERTKDHNYSKNKKVIISSSTKFLISGTLGNTYGTLQGIEFFKSTLKHLPNASLHIIGYSADISYKKQLLKACDDLENIKVTVANEPISHDLILEAIQQADVGLLPYEINDNLRYRIPTKFYEYTALQLPFLIPKNEIWEGFINHYHAGLAISFKEEMNSELILKLSNITFYRGENLNDIYWNSEEIKLLKIINSLA